jgi:hypothetical protein
MRSAGTSPHRRHACVGADESVLEAEQRSPVLQRSSVRRRRPWALQHDDEPRRCIQSRLPSQMSVLPHLQHQGPATMTALARAEGVRPQSMGATVSVPHVAGLVSGHPTRPTVDKRFCPSLLPPGMRSRLAGRYEKTGCSEPFDEARAGRAGGTGKRHRTAQAAGRSTARPRVQYQDRATAPLSG